MIHVYLRGSCFTDMCVNVYKMYIQFRI